jgi:pyruvate/2-oxoglutarate dehydrogenase complex dihydrolipoamide acyltransferase (E2) component
MQATTLERIQQGTPVLLPTSIGTVTVDSWWVRPGQMVNAGDTLATVGAGNMRRGIVSPIAGKVRALTAREGATVQAGATLAYVEPEGPPQARQLAPQRATAPLVGKPKQPTTTALQSATDPLQRLCYEDREALDLLDQATQEEPGNRTGANQYTVNSGTVKNLNSSSLEERPAGTTRTYALRKLRKDRPDLHEQEAPGAAVAVVSKRHFSHLSPGKPTRERTKHRGFYILPSQERAIKRLVADLALDDDKPLVCNDSLLVRAAIDVLLSLPPAALRATVATYKEREAAAQVGSGWPRPGKR